MNFELPVRPPPQVEIRLHGGRMPAFGGYLETPRAAQAGGL